MKFFTNCAYEKIAHNIKVLLSEKIGKKIDLKNKEHEKLVRQTLKDFCFIINN